LFKKTLSAQTEKQLFSCFANILFILRKKIFYARKTGLFDNKHYCEPTDFFWAKRKTYFSGWCLSVRMYLTVTQNKRLPRDYFLGWCFFVHMHFSVTQSRRLPFLGMVSFCAHYFSATQNICLSRDYFCYVFVNHANVCKYLSVCNSDVFLPRDYFFGWWFPSVRMGL